jgi:hypothetical protein
VVGVLDGCSLGELLSAEVQQLVPRGQGRQMRARRQAGKQAAGARSE